MRTTTKVRATCGICGHHSRWCDPTPSGRVDLFEIGYGWWVAPYPHDFVHENGTTGDRFTCPSCAKQIEAAS
jgi:transcription elongation factor Elf1